MARPASRGTHGCAYHSHLGEIEKTFVGEVRCALLDEGKIGEIHAEVRDTRRIASVERFSHVAETAISRDERLKFIDRLLRLRVCRRKRQSVVAGDAMRAVIAARSTAKGGKEEMS